MLTYGLGVNLVRDIGGGGLTTELIDLEIRDTLIHTSIEVQDLSAELYNPLQTTITFIKDDVTLNNIITEDVEIC